VDNISGVLGLLNLANTWTASNTFTQPIIDTATTNQLVFGTAGNQTTLNAPAPAGNVTINLPTTADTLVGLVATQSLTNKTLPAGNIIGNFTVDAVYGTYRVTSDQTITAGASLQAIPGLSWTMPANTAVNAAFECHLQYLQNAAPFADSFGIQDVTVAPTYLMANGQVYTSNTAIVATNQQVTTNTAATITIFTPSGAATIFNADLYGLIEQPSNASTSVVQIMTQFTTNTGVIKRGSFCRVF
jgi:hypothetical protein